MKQQTSIIIGLKDGMVLLGMKKRGHGAGYWNGFGGKREKNETMFESALREIREEAGIEPLDMQEVGVLDLSIFETHVYTFSDYEGEIVETEEMKPEWFKNDEIPYDLMWESDKVWLPVLLKGKKFKADFVFENKKMIDYNLAIEGE